MIVRNESLETGGSPAPNLEPVSIYGLPVVLTAIAGALVLSYIASQFWNDYQGGEVAAALARLFDVGSEANVPTWYSALLWQIAALCALIAAKERDSWHLGSLALLFMLMSLDEIASIHETLGTMAGSFIRGAIGLPGHFYYNWVVFGCAFVLAVAAIYARFLLRLPRQVLATLALAGLLFVSGAIGLETLSSAVQSGALSFPAGLTFRRAVLVEEFLEMMGVIVLIHGLLRLRFGLSLLARQRRSSGTLAKQVP